MSVDLSLIYLNDVFHSFQTIVESEDLGGSSMLMSEGLPLHQSGVWNLILPDPGSTILNLSEFYDDFWVCINLFTI